MADPSLIFGDFDLHGPGSSWVCDTTAPGTQFGSADPLVKELTSFLQDGAAVLTTGYGNRELEVSLRIKAQDAGALAAAEAALVAECTRCEDGRWNTLTWSPPDIYGPACVFEVVAASVVPADSERSDLGEVQAPLWRDWTLKVTCLPFVRSLRETTVTVDPPATSITTVSVDDCTSTTGWAVADNDPAIAPSLTTSGGSVILTDDPPAGTAYQATLARTGLSASMTATPYLRIQYASTWPCDVRINGVREDPVAVNGSVAWFECPDPTLTDVKFFVSVPRKGEVGAYLVVSDISRSNVAFDSAASTARQSSRILPIAGTARTPASLLLTRTGATGQPGFGTVLVHTAPASSALVQPPLRQWLQAGPTTTADTTLVSGYSSDTATSHEFRLPASGMPAGPYLLLARVKSAAGGSRTLSWAAGGIASTGGGISSGDLQTGSASITSTTAFQVVEVGLLNLPALQVGDGGQVRLTLSATGGDLLLDEAWLFNLDKGRLTWIECGTGTNPNVLWLDAPTLDSPTPSAWLAYDVADRSTSFHAGPAIQSFGAHAFTPDEVNAFTVTTNSVNTQLQATYFPRWHTHAGQ